MNTNRQARELHKIIKPNQYGVSPYQWGYVAAIHPRRAGTLSANLTAGAMQFSSSISIEPNALVSIASGPPLQVLSSSGAGPFTVTLTGRSAPTSQSSGAAVRVIPTVDLYLDGWQSPPGNLAPGVQKTLTVGVRYVYSYAPVVGHVVLVGRGTGMQRSDRVVLGALSPATNPKGRMFNTAATTIANTATTQITSMAKDYALGGVTFASNALTVPLSGPYLIIGSIQSANGTANAALGGTMAVIVERNGTKFIRGSADFNLDFPSLSCSDVRELNAGDTLTLFGGNLTGGNAFVDPSNGNQLASYLSIAWQP